MTEDEYNPDDVIHWEAPDEVWTYRAMPDPWSHYTAGVLDGDTYDLLIDKGFRDYSRQRVRAVHVDTAEIWSADNDEEYEIATEHRQFARDCMTAAADTTDNMWPLVIRTRRDTDAWGRWLAEVFTHDGDSVERALIAEYDDTPYFRWGDLY